jgi:benzoate/toluate 1,2-dioxygenase alpha subunit
MDGSLMEGGFGALVDDRPDDLVFRVDRAVYTDQAVFNAEMEFIFERGWVFLCHESQVPEAGSYFATQIGRQPVVVIRQDDGDIRTFINACTHRGAKLTPMKQGKAKVLTCRFHGWSFGCDGRCVRIKSEKEGFPEEGFDRSQYNLSEVAKTESYRGFVFGSLVADVPPIKEYLAAAAKWIDLIVDQSADGLEVVPGSSTYIIDGNWKMQAENSVDGYHVSTVHRVFAATVGNREMRDGTSGLAQTEGGRITGKVPSGAYDLGGGHMSIWAAHTTPERRPIYRRKAWLKENYTAAEVHWILEKGRNLCLFPNVMIMDNPSTQIRFLRPVSAERSEITVYCIAPVGEDNDARAARIRKFEDFYLTAGMATSDDMAALEDTQAGSWAKTDRWNDFSRGMTTMIHGADEGAKAVGFEPLSSTSSWENETLYYGFYRRWRDMMVAGENND